MKQRNLGMIGLLLTLVLSGCTKQKISETNHNKPVIVKEKSAEKVEKKWVPGVAKQLKGIYTDGDIQYLNLVDEAPNIGSAERVFYNDPQTYQLTNNVYLLKGTDWSLEPGKNLYIKLIVKGSGKSKKIGIYGDRRFNYYSYNLADIKARKHIDSWFQITDKDGLQGGEPGSSNRNKKMYFSNDRVFYDQTAKDHSKFFVYLGNKECVFSDVTTAGKYKGKTEIANPIYKVKGNTLIIDGEKNIYAPWQTPILLKILSPTKLLNQKTGRTFSLYNGNYDDFRR